MTATEISSPNHAGGWGIGSPIRRSDLALLRKAIREGWDVPKGTRREIMDRLKECLESDRHNGRLAIRAAEVILEMSRQNLLTDDD